MELKDGERGEFCLCRVIRKGKGFWTGVENRTALVRRGIPGAVAVLGMRVCTNGLAVERKDVR